VISNPKQPIRVTKHISKNDFDGNNKIMTTEEEIKTYVYLERLGHLFDA